MRSIVFAVIVALCSVFPARAGTFWDYDDITDDILSTDEFMLGSETRGNVYNVPWSVLIDELIADGGVLTGTSETVLFDSDIGAAVQGYDIDIATAQPTAGEISAGSETAVRAWSPANTWAAVASFLEVSYGHETPLAAEPVGAWVGQIALADNSSWDPSAIDGTTPYWAICTATGSPGSWTGFLSADGNLIVSSIELLEYTTETLNDTSTPHDLLDAELKGVLVTNYGATESRTFNAPAAAGGWNVTFQIIAAQSMIINPNGTEQWYLNGTQLAAGENIQNTSPTRGESMVCFSAQTGSTPSYAVFCESKYSDWAEETP